MSYKTILVHADPSPHSDRRLKLATRVGNLFEASVIGVGAEAFDPMVITAAGCGVADGVVLDAVRRRIQMDLPAAEKRFRDLCSGRRGDRWIACEDYPAKVLALEARAADLIVAARPAHGTDAAYAAKPAELIMEAGCPVLLAADGEREFSGERAIVAWKDSRESRRALTDSLPLLKQAKSVIIVGVCGDPSTIVDQGGMQDVARRLASHRIEATIEVVPRGNRAVCSALEETANRHGADLIVTGAYGHSRLREWALGGVTEDLIAASSKFVLFSH